MLKNLNVFVCMHVCVYGYKDTYLYLCSCEERTTIVYLSQMERCI